MAYRKNTFGMPPTSSTPPKKRRIHLRLNRRLLIVVALLLLVSVAAGVYFYVHWQQAKTQRITEAVTSKLDDSEIKSTVDDDRAIAYGSFVAEGKDTAAADVYGELVESTAERSEKLKLLREYQKVARLYENHAQEIEAARQYAEIMNTYDSFWAASSIAGRYGETALQREYLLKAYELGGIAENNEDKREKLLAEDIAFQAELREGVE